MKSNVHLSVVSPVFNAQECLEELYRRIQAAARGITNDFEIVLVDDASHDDSWRVIQDLAASDSRVRGIRFARNFGQHHAVTAGLEAARGEWVVVLDCDLQDRPEEIPRLYAKATREGHLCVMGRRAQRHGGVLRRLQSWVFYRVFSYLTDIPYDASVSNYSIAARQVVDDVLRMRESVRYYPGFLFWLGYPTGFLDVQHDPRFAGDTSYTFRKLWRHSQGIIFAHSTKPLELCVNLGLIVALLAVMVGLAYLVWTTLYGSAVSGWASLIISLYFSTGAIIFTIGIVGLYVGRIFTEVKNRPPYVIRTRTFDE